MRQLDIIMRAVEGPVQSAVSLKQAFCCWLPAACLGLDPPPALSHLPHKKHILWRRKLSMPLLRRSRRGLPQPLRPTKTSSRYDRTESCPAYWVLTLQAYKLCVCQPSSTCT
jgi:hypothetical protein